MANPPRVVSAQRRLLSAARAIATYQFGLPVGCIRVQRILLQDPELSQVQELGPLLPVFHEYMNAVSGLQLSSERLLWHREALQESDRRLEAINAAFRDRVFDSCFEIIEIIERSGVAL